MLFVLVGVALGAVMASPAFALPAPQQQALQQPGGGQRNDEFGASVAVEGDTLVVGAPGAGPPSGAPGVIYVFARSGNTFHQTGMLTASNGAAGDRLGAAVAIDGDVIVAGAPGADRGNGDEQGTVYTFATTGAADRPQIKEFNSPAAAHSHLGTSVAIDGNEIVAGAPDDDSGIVVTFDANCAAPCTPTHYLFNSDHGYSDDLGASVAIDGNVIVAGAPNAPTGGPSGAVYTFDRVAPNGFQVENAKLVGGSHIGELGRSVAIDGDTIVAGAPISANGGEALLFATSGPTPRAPTATLGAKNGGRDFGVSVGIDGPTIAVSDDKALTDAGTYSGVVYTFARTGPTDRHERSTLQTEEPPTFANSATVAISGDTILAGAPSEISAFNSTGFATAFFADRVPPDTQGLHGPKKVKQGRKAKFRFRSNEKGSKFKCRVDGEKAYHCDSPEKVGTRNLGPGRHTFSVYAIDPADNKDETPAKAEFKVVEPKR